MADTPETTFVCVKWGTKYHAAYVNILFDMVRRNLPADFPKKFVCFTENAEGIDKDIEIRSLSGDLKGWWNKLYLFKPGVFKTDERVFFIDLDTAIIGDISEIARYQGAFIILRDFYRPRGLGSGVMMWRGGFGTHIWNSFVEAGMPEIDGGDQVWIERCVKSPDILQDVFPGSFVSYKEHSRIAPPAGVKIVCFHGEPKPDEVRGGWVEQVWRMGGHFEGGMTTSINAEELANVKHALTLSYPNLQQAVDADTEHHICIVGNGSSAQHHVEELQQRQQQGHKIWALDGAYQALKEGGITANVHVMASLKAENVALVPVSTSATLLYASTCHPNVFKYAANASKQVFIWHPMIDGIRNVLGDRKVVLVNGGSTVGMLAIGLAYTLGIRNIDLYGYDSSYSTAEANKTAHINVKIDGVSFPTSVHLAQQVNEFRTLLGRLVPQGVTITLHGDGLLPYVMQKLSQQAATQTP